MVVANLKRATTVLIGRGQGEGGHNLEDGRGGRPSGSQLYRTDHFTLARRGVP
jgi:hypothetical protein